MGDVCVGAAACDYGCDRSGVAGRATCESGRYAVRVVGCNPPEPQYDASLLEAGALDAGDGR
jgi:hypothetical protein